MQIEIKGLASGQSLFINFNEEDLQQNLLIFLRSKGVTIASSCDGNGVCRKCMIQNDWLTCEMTLKEFLQRQNDKRITINYL